MLIRDRATWDKRVEERLDAVYGAKPYGPDLPALLDEAFAAKRSPAETVDLLGKRFRLQVLESWKNRPRPVRS